MEMMTFFVRMGGDGSQLYGDEAGQENFTRKGKDRADFHYRVIL